MPAKPELQQKTRADTCYATGTDVNICIVSLSLEEYLLTLERKWLGAATEHAMRQRL